MIKQTIDVVIPTLNRIDQIQQCIESILTQTYKPTSIIVVDAGKTTILEQIIRKKYPNESIIYIKSKKGLPYQRNVGIEQCKSDYILFLDDDIVLTNNFIEQTFKAFEAKPEFGVVTGKIINPDRKSKVNPLMILFQKLFYLTEAKKNGFKKSGAYNVKPLSLEGLHEVDIAIGGLTTYRRQIFIDLKFDTTYQFLDGYASLEDEDFSLQMKKKYRILYSTDAQAYHYHKSSPETRLSVENKAKIRSFNYRYFYRKHRKYYNFKPFPHFISCVGMLIDALLNRKSVIMVKGLIVGFILYSRKKLELENFKNGKLRN